MLPSPFPPPATKRTTASRTPLFAALRRIMRLAVMSNRHDAPPVDELVDSSNFSENVWSRRDFLKVSSGAVAALGMAYSPLINAAARHLDGPRIAIIGAGIAGLNAAYTLKKAGIHAALYEANTRAGGRIYTARNIVAPGLTTELGGEFIDSGHEDMLQLASEFGLELLDRELPAEAVLKSGYFFAGQHYTETQIIEAFRPLAARIQADTETLGEIVDFENEGNATRLDNMSIAEYLESIGATGWIRDLLTVAYVTEYGLEADHQSALNLIFLISTDVSNNKFAVFGDSDERYKIKGGNQRITSALEQRLRGQIHLGYRLEAIAEKKTGFVLVFQAPSGRVRDIRVDVVIMTLPFSVLRDVDMRVDLPGFKRRAIAELGYGTNAKVLVGMQQRIWRNQGYQGDILTDEAFQLAWDNSQLQPGVEGGLTLYSGGRAGLKVGKGTPLQQADRLMVGVEKAFPGVNALRNGRVARFHWPSFPYAKASYACYKPGQWTTIAGAEIKPVGRLFFAGEHCSYDFQGYMNGGAETGRRAAEAVLETLGVDALISTASRLAVNR